MTKSENVIGLHYGHDATVVLIRDGEVVEAMSEERLSRLKKHIGFPKLALDYLKQKYQLTAINKVFVVGEHHSDIITWDKKRFEEERELRKIKPDWYLRGIFSRISALVILLDLRQWVYKFLGKESQAKTLVNGRLREEFPEAEIKFINHHEAHLWAAIPFLEKRNEKQVIISLDGEGDRLSGMIGVFDKGKMNIKKRFSNAVSLGLLYSAVTEVLGMSRNEHEFKVMGLAPYAKESVGMEAYEKLKSILWFDEETMSFKTTNDMRRVMAYLVAHNINTAFRFDSLAYGIQRLTEVITQKMVRESINRYGTSNVALGGGVFMNVKANQFISEMSEVDGLTITPSCGDESVALGAAVYGYGVMHDNDFSSFQPLSHLYLGSDYSETEIKKAIDDYNVPSDWRVKYFDRPNGEVIEKEVAKLLSKNSVVGRFSGRAEWGARALGNRSILANPTSRDNVKLINEMIKGRDFWMPFATSMLYERRDDYLENPQDIYAPYMAVTFNTKPLAHKELIAALHPYDLTSRPQMVKAEVNPAYHALIREFEALTGIGGILNTSFNLHGEPNVERPEDALRTFEKSGLPHLAIGNYLLSKN